MKNKSEIEKMIKEKIDCLKCLEKNAKILYLESIIDKNNINEWVKDFNKFKFNKEILTKEKINIIINNFKNVNLIIEVQKFIDYWTVKEKPKTWSGYRRLLTWLQKAAKDNNEGFNTGRFSKSKNVPVKRGIDKYSEEFAKKHKFYQSELKKNKNNS